MVLIKSKDTGWKFIKNFKFTDLWFVKNVSASTSGLLMLEVEVSRFFGLYTHKFWIDEHDVYEVNSCDGR